MDNEWNKRFFSGHGKPFFGCVNERGEWFDSSLDFRQAVQWVAYSHGEMELTKEEELKFLDSVNDSIIHSSLLETLVKAGIVK